MKTPEIPAIIPWTHELEGKRLRLMCLPPGGAPFFIEREVSNFVGPLDRIDNFLTPEKSDLTGENYSMARFVGNWESSQS